MSLLVTPAACVDVIDIELELGVEDGDEVDEGEDDDDDVDGVDVDAALLEDCCRVSKCTMIGVAVALGKG